MSFSAPTKAIFAVLDRKDNIRVCSSYEQGRVILLCKGNHARFCPNDRWLVTENADGDLTLHDLSAIAHESPPAGDCQCLPKRSRK